MCTSRNPVYRNNHFFQPLCNLTILEMQTNQPATLLFYQTTSNNLRFDNSWDEDNLYNLSNIFLSIQDREYGPGSHIATIKLEWISFPLWVKSFFLLELWVNNLKLANYLVNKTSNWQIMKEYMFFKIPWPIHRHELKSIENSKHKYIKYLYIT